jgi:hypothetical protein
MDTLLPAVALLENAIVPELFPEVSASVLKVWLTPELFVMPLMVSVNPGFAVMV